MVGTRMPPTSKAGKSMHPEQRKDVTKKEESNSKVKEERGKKEPEQRPKHKKVEKHKATKTEKKDKSDKKHERERKNTREQADDMANLKRKMKAELLTEDDLEKLDKLHEPEFAGPIEEGWYSGGRRRDTEGGDRRSDKEGGDRRSDTEGDDRHSDTEANVILNSSKASGSRRPVSPEKFVGVPPRPKGPFPLQTRRLMPTQPAGPPPHLQRPGPVAAKARPAFAMAIGPIPRIVKAKPPAGPPAFHAALQERAKVLQQGGMWQASKGLF